MITLYLNPDKPLMEDLDITLCLGYFDGIHLGHQALIAKAKSLGKEVGVMTLSRSPGYVVEGKKEEILTSVEDRERILEGLGVDYCFVLEFSKKTASLKAAEFFELVIQQIDPKNIVCGPDYRFGKGGEGDVRTLANLAGYFKQLHVFDFIKENGRKVSSGDIFAFLKAGDIESANRLLSRPYSVLGTVVEGLHNGMKIGYKTANLNLSDNYLLPKVGVYAARVEIGGESYHAMVNIGTHPTVDRLDAAIIEVHILDYDEDIYGMEMRVHFLERLRDEIEFPSLDDLLAQLRTNEGYIRKKYLKG